MPHCQNAHLPHPPVFFTRSTRNNRRPSAWIKPNSATFSPPPSSPWPSHTICPVDVNCLCRSTAHGRQIPRFHCACHSCLIHGREALCHSRQSSHHATFCSQHGRQSSGHSRNRNITAVELTTPHTPRVPAESQFPSTRRRILHDTTPRLSLARHTTKHRRRILHDTTPRLSLARHTTQHQRRILHDTTPQRSPPRHNISLARHTANSPQPPRGDPSLSLRPAPPHQPPRCVRERSARATLTVRRISSPSPASPRGPVAIAPPRTASPPSAMRPRKVGKGYTHRPPDFVPLPPASPRGPVAIAPPRTASPPSAMRPRKVGKGYTHRPPDFVPLPPASPRGPVAIAPPRTASPPSAMRPRKVGKGYTHRPPDFVPLPPAVVGNPHAPSRGGEGDEGRRGGGDSTPLPPPLPHFEFSTRRLRQRGARCARHSPLRGGRRISFEPPATKRSPAARLSPRSTAGTRLAGRLQRQRVDKARSRLFLVAPLRCATAWGWPPTPPIGGGPPNPR